jgi:hypothetical protein
VGGTFYDGGTERALPVSSGIQYLARLANGGLLVHAPANTRAQPTFVVDASGATVLRLGDVQDIRANADGSRFTTIDAAGTIRLRDPMGRVLATLRTGDTNASVRGFFADRVYYTVLADGSGRGTTRSWDPASGDTRDVTAGRFQAVHEASGLAILVPDQAYDPDHTCYGMYDIAAGRVRWWSCGAFAPTAFGAGGTIVVGPEVADGPGTTRFRTASTRDGSVIGRVALTGGAWSPSWIGHDAKGLTFTLLNRESPTRQVLAACSLPNYGCSIDSAPATVTAAQRDSFMWPIVLAAN